MAGTLARIAVKQRGSGSVLITHYDVSDCKDRDYWEFGLTKVEPGRELVEVAIVNYAFDDDHEEFETGRRTFTGPTTTA